MATTHLRDPPQSVVLNVLVGVLVAQHDDCRCETGHHARVAIRLAAGVRKDNADFGTVYAPVWASLRVVCESRRPFHFDNQKRQTPGAMSGRVFGLKDPSLTCSE